MNRVELKILLIVATKLGKNENLASGSLIIYSIRKCYRWLKSPCVLAALNQKGLSAMIISWQLVDPKDVANLSIQMGNLLIFRYHESTCGNTR